MSDENDESGNVSLYPYPFFSSTQKMLDENDEVLYPRVRDISNETDTTLYSTPRAINNPSAYVGGNEPPVKYTYENKPPSGVTLTNAPGGSTTTSTTSSGAKKAFKDFFSGDSSTGTYASALLGLLGLYEAIQKNKQRNANQPTQTPLNLKKYKYAPGATNKPAPRAYGAGAMGQNYGGALVPASEVIAPAVPPVTIPTEPVQAAAGGIMGLASGGSANPPRYLRGKTDGMADMLDTSIEGVQPAKLSHGEFVIPADVVGHLGNGNSEAGAEVLYKMLDRVRQARTGNKKQGKRIDPNKFMPGGLASLNNYAAGGQVAFETGGKIAAGTSVSSSLSPWAQPYVSDMLEKGAALSDKPYEAYGGQLTAGTSPLQQKAFDAASNLSVPASVGQASTMIKSAGDKLGNLSYSSTPVSSTYTAPTGYTAGQVGNLYTGTGEYTPGATTNQFSAPADYKAGEYSNQFTGTGAYTPQTATSQYSGIGAYTPTTASSTFSGPAAYQAGEFSNQYGGIAAYAPQAAANQFKGPAGYQATKFDSQYKGISPYEARDITVDKFNTAAMRDYMNPYLQMSLEPQIAEARRQSQITQMGNAAKLAQAGAYGGSRGALMDTETQRNLLQNLAGITGQGYNTAFNTALNAFNTQQGLGVQAQQASEASRQFGANQALTNAQNLAKFGMDAQTASEASKQFGAGQAMTAAQQAAQYGQAAQAQSAQERQFASSQALANAQTKAQYGQAAAAAREASRQFGAGQAMTAAQSAAQYGMAAQQLNAQQQQFASSQALANAQAAAQYGQAAQTQNMQQQQFGASQALANAQTAAQYGQAAQAQRMQDLQFGAGQAMTGAQTAAQYGQAAQALSAQQQQFAASQALANAQNTAQYGLAGFTAGEQAKQAQGAQALTAAQNASQAAQAAQALNAQQQQFGANLGLNALQGQLTAGSALGGLGVQENQLGLANLNALAAQGATQSSIEQAALDAQRGQFQESQLYPYKQLQFQQSLLTGLPIGAQTATGGGSLFSDLTQGIGGLLGLQESIDKAAPKTPK